MNDNYKKRTLKIILLGLIFSSFLNATIKKEAFLIGISEYNNPQINLDGIDKDITKMTKLLKDRGFNIKTLINSEATLANVRDAFRSYQNLSSNDIFVFYDSSHGTQVPDLNGDEVDDNLDEAYVLYDVDMTSRGIASMKGLLLDDELDALLSKIKAKKVMFVDACHSGSMYKGFNMRLKSKFVRYTKSFQPKSNTNVLGNIPKPKNLVALSASQDNQRSLASPEGSLFTSAIYDAWSSKKNITFEKLEELTTKHIENSCQIARARGETVDTFTPSLYATNDNLKSKSINSFLEVNININNSINLVEEYFDNLISNRKVGWLTLNSKNSYNNEENITFNIDTHNNKGFLYILTIPDGEHNIEVLYPNPYYQTKGEQWKGNFNFPLLNRGFKFQAYNDTKKHQRTVVYIILSEQKIPELEISRANSLSHFQSIPKTFGGQSGIKNLIKNILIQKSGNRLSIAKEIFSVTP